MKEKNIQISRKTKTPESVKNKNKRDVIKIVLFNIINIILIVALLFFVQRLPTEAEKVKNLRSEQIAAQESLSVGVLKADLENNQSNIDAMENAFVDEEKFIDFVTSIEQIRTQGVLQEFSFPVTNPVADKDKNLGLPVSVVLRGNIDSINSTVEQIIGLPYLIRSVNANLESLNDEEQNYILRLGLFIYVNEDFSKN